MSVTHIRNLWVQKNYFRPNSVILITGAASGIGKHVAMVYAKRGVRLILFDMSQSGLETTARLCENLGSTVLKCVVDVTDEASVVKNVERGVELFGGIDIMVLCAGIAAHHLFSKTTDSNIFDKLMKVNFFGYLYCVKAAYKYLIESQGNLVAITSFSGEVGLPYRSAYCASKFAVTGFLESLRSEMELTSKQDGKKFHITIVCPPTINTNLRKNSLTLDTSLREAGKANGNSMTVSECADAIIDAADRRLRKAFFPFKSFLASYLRPLVPDLIDGMIRKRAAL